MTIQEKYKKLQECLLSLESVAVAFSSGVDSTFLLKAAADTLGTGNVVAVTASSSLFPQRETEETETFCGKNGIRHVVFQAQQLDVEGFCQNPKNRCYLCKRELFSKILAIAKEHGMKAVAEGSNMDDNGDYRPGLLAVQELGIKSPLRAAGLAKDEIRALSKEMGLLTWKKPSFACLASRFVYGEPISEERLQMVGQAEQFLLDMGFSQVRVRIHGQGKAALARIEVFPHEFPKLLQEENRIRIQQHLKETGFSYVSFDICGYRTGSMNETL